MFSKIVHLLFWSGFAALLAAEPCGLLLPSHSTADLDSSSLITEAQKSLFHNSAGYPFATVRIEAHRTLPDGEWGWSCLDHQGDRYSIASLINHGTSRSSSEQIEKMAGRHRGTLWEHNSLDKMEQKALRSGYFYRSGPAYWTPVPRRQLLQPHLHLSDLPVRRLELQLESDETAEGVGGIFLLDWRNLAGSGRDFEAYYRSLESDRLEAEFSYKEPWLFGGPALRLQGGGESIDSSYSRLWGEAGGEWGFDRLIISLYAGAERVIEREEEERFNRSSRWGRAKGEIDLRHFPQQQLQMVPVGGICQVNTELIRPEKGEFWSRWGGDCRWNTALQNSRFLLNHRVAFAGRWPWRAGWTREGLYRWGGAGSLRGYRQKELQSIGYGLVSLQPEWLLSKRWRSQLFLDGAADYTIQQPATALSRWGWGGGVGWNGESVHLSLQLAWPETAPTLRNALFLLSWDNRF